MKTFYKSISVIFHPIVLPTIGLMLYFLLIPSAYNSKQKLILLSLLFATTYIIPLVILIVFKKLKLIASYNVTTIKERKLPVAIMVVLFYMLGNVLIHIPQSEDIGLLFYATSFALVIVYLCFALAIKASLHLLSFGVLCGFFIILGFIYAKPFPLVLIVALALAGVVGNARLYLKCHTPTEVYLGYFIGFTAPFAIYFIL